MAFHAPNRTSIGLDEYPDTP